MRIQLHAHGPHVSSDLGRHTTRRIRFALGRFRDRVRGVAVRFSDPNGPRGGVDAQCQVRVSLATGEVVIVDELAADPFVAVGRAADRVRRVVAEKIDRVRTRRRRGSAA